MADNNINQNQHKINIMSNNELQFRWNLLSNPRDRQANFNSIYDGLLDLDKENKEKYDLEKRIRLLENKVLKQDDYNENLTQKLQYIFEKQVSQGERMTVIESLIANTVTKEIFRTEHAKMKNEFEQIRTEVDQEVKKTKSEQEQIKNLVNEELKNNDKIFNSLKENKIKFNQNNPFNEENNKKKYHSQNNIKLINNLINNNDDEIFGKKK